LKLQLFLPDPFPEDMFPEHAINGKKEDINGKKDDIADPSKELNP